MRNAPQRQDAQKGSSVRPFLPEEYDDNVLPRDRDHTEHRHGVERDGR